MFRLVLDVVVMLLVGLPGIAPVLDAVAVPCAAAALDAAAAPAADAVSEVNIAEWVASTEDAEVRIAFAAREGVCGDGETYISTDDGRRHHFGRVDCDDHQWRDCEKGPVRVSLRVREGRVVKVKTYVGGDWKRPLADSLDLGEVAPEAAAAYLISLAKSGNRRAAEDALFPATLARDVVVWPDLLEIARDSSQHQELREISLFWLSQIAGEKVTENLEQIVADEDEELELREHAIFALTQRSEEVYVPALLKISRTSRHPQLRETALFWLAQSKDPRVLDLFEQILLEE